MNKSKPNKNKKYINMIESFINDLSYFQKSDFFSILKEIYDSNNFVIDSELEKIIQKSLLSKYDLKIIKTDNVNNINEKWIEELYYDDLHELMQILSSKELLKKINGAKILLYGETGTGKTSVVQSIIKKFQNYEYIEKDFTTLLSSKMGQTQINLMNFAYELNKNDQPKIIFLDEIDSIITNRINSDLGEHSRIVGTFIQFIDKLPYNVIFIAATNIKNTLDDAVLRRFNIKFETRKASWKETINILNKENFFISKNREKSISKLIEIDNLKFSFADIKLLLDKKNIYKYINKKLDDWEIFLKVFNELINEPVSQKLSVREKKTLCLIDRKD